MPLLFITNRGSRVGDEVEEGGVAVTRYVRLFVLLLVGTLQPRLPRPD